MLWRNKTKKSIVMQHFLQVPLWTIRLGGMKIIKCKSEERTTAWEYLYSVMMMSNLFFNLICIAAVPIADGFENILHLTTWIIFCSFGAICVSKLVSLMLMSEVLHDIIRQLQFIFPKTAKERRDVKLQEHYMKLMTYMRFLRRFHYITTVLLIMGALLQSMFEYLTNLEESKKFVYRLPFVTSYPYDSQKPVAFALTYVSQFIGGLTVSWNFHGVDMLLIAFVKLLIMHFDHLLTRIKYFKAQGEKPDINELKTIMKRHSMLLEYAEQVNQVFSIPSLLNYMLSVVTICLMGFQVVAGSEFFNLVRFGVFFISSLIDIYIICRTGTELITSSEQVADELFGQEWYHASVYYQRMLPLAIARAQRPAQLTAHKFFVITMESFTNLVTTSYQFFTLIKTRYDESNQM